MPGRQAQPSPAKTNRLAIAGLILAFLVPPIGLICSSLGLWQLNQRPGRGQRLAIAGLIISIIMGVVQTVTILMLLTTVSSNQLTLTTYRNQAQGYSVQYPIGWQIGRDDVGDTKGIIIKNDYGNTGKVSGQVEIVYIAPPASNYSQDVLAVIAGNIKRTNPGTTVLTTSRTAKNGQQRLTMTTTYDGDGGRVEAKTTIILTKASAIYIVSTQAPQANWSRYQTGFNQVHDSFSLL